MKIHKLSKEFIFFIGSALFAAGSDILIFSALVMLSVNVYLSQGCARIIGGVASFCFNKKFNFQKNKGRSLIEARRFLLLYIVSYGLSMTLLWVMHDALQLPIMYAKIGADGSCFIFNFIVSKIYVYHTTRGLIDRSLSLAKEKWVR